ncbi:MAG TPA: hypothetical protein VF958_06855 [Thermoanaerobaculia bacterium]
MPDLCSFHPSIWSGFPGRLGDPMPPQPEVRRRDSAEPNPAPLVVSAADPLNLPGILTPDGRVAPGSSRQVRVA